MAIRQGSIGSIAAVSPEWAIGLHNTVPWHHPGDFRRFKRVTLGGTVIMGRLTWESMNRKPLPRRRNLVVTRHEEAGVECFPTVEAALTEAVANAAAQDSPNVWFVGGARIYEEAMALVDLVDITFVPDPVTDPSAVRFPAIDEGIFEAGPLTPHEDEAGLYRRVYRRRAPA